MNSTPTPTTIGELAIFVGTKLEFLEKELNGLPSRVQSLESEVQSLKQRSADKRIWVLNLLGWAAAIGAGAFGVIHG